MKFPICSEHLLHGEIWTDGRWISASCYVRLGDRAQIQIEFVRSDWETVTLVTEEIDDFADNVTSMLISGGVCAASVGPIWRHRISMRVDQNGLPQMVNGTLSISLTESSTGGFPHEISIQLDGDSLIATHWHVEGVVAKIKGAQCCATCRFGMNMIYGGQDSLFDLYCFRDSPDFQGKESAKQFDSNEWNRVAHSHTPALHWCPAFQPKD